MSGERKPDPNKRFRSAVTPHNAVAAWGLAANDKLKPLGNVANAVIVLQKDPRWGPSELWHDAFLDRVQTQDGDTAREWRDDDDTRLTVYMQQSIGMTTISESQVASAVRYVARQRPRHCVRDHVQAFSWDGVERIEHAFEDFWGVVPAANQPCAYVRAISANFFIALIARIMQPGCQVDTMVIFEGLQGIGKSSALRVLGGAWYMLASESVTSKDFFQVLAGCWVSEIGEMDSLSRAERGRAKLVISTPTDRYRPSYGRHARDFPRQCIFAGTTNHDDYGDDDTGLRRFLPVRCGELDIPGLTIARPQLLAEALHWFRQGRSWWEVPLAVDAQSDRQAGDVWTDTVLDAAIGKPDVAIADLLRDALKIRDADMTRAQELRVGRILKLAGWTKKPARRLGKLCKRWFPPDDE